MASHLVGVVHIFNVEITDCSIILSRAVAQLINTKHDCSSLQKLLNCTVFKQGGRGPQAGGWGGGGGGGRWLLVGSIFPIDLNLIVKS